MLRSNAAEPSAEINEWRNHEILQEQA